MLCRLKDVLNTTLDRLGCRGRLRSLAAIQAWNEDIAPRLSTESRAVFIRNKVLHVTVSEPVWAHQLSMMKQDLIDKLTALAGEGAIADIRFRTGQIREPLIWEAGPREQAAAASATVAVPVFNRAEIEVDPHVRAQAEATAAPISDADLRRRFEEFMLLDSGYREWLGRNLTTAAADIARILRREPWLPNKDLRLLVPEATSDDLLRAREVVAAEFREEVSSRVLAAAGSATAAADAKEAQVELRLLIESMAMLLTGEPPERVDDELVAYVLGEEYASYVRHNEKTG